MGGCQRRLRPTPFVQRDVPRGAIFWWSGSIASIPPTYRLCDGTRLTPDLRNKFIVGAGDTYSVDDKGGTLTHAHTFTSFGHPHALGGGTDIKELPNNISADLSIEQLTGTFDPSSSLPPYHSIVLVMYDGRLL